ncbi:hypothetical protein A3K64_01505 [Candidatus Micrarchaeota archaeon RBG_16_36_9]|nr:MAG: hypothetical protein A3K64_01505 [Candidatus Micrarchaeota archaeon RBG_16_36_9]
MLAYIVIPLSFIITFTALKRWIKSAKKIGMEGYDMNKLSKPKVVESGGVCVIFGISIAILSFVFIESFYFNEKNNLLQIFTLLSSILMAGLIGFVDDVLGWKKGLKQWQKPLLTIPVAIPLMAINAGNSIMSLPFLGNFDFGILYSLIIIPVGLIGATNGFNMLAGYNGLESGMSIVILSTLGIKAYMSGIFWLTILIFSAVFSLVAFLKFNWYPAKIFPGNSLTYLVGAMIASFAILGDMEKTAIILFLPYFLTFALKARSRFRAESFAKVGKDGGLSKPYKKFYDVTHVSLAILNKLKNKVSEKDVVLFIIGIEILISAIALMFV